MEVNNQVSSFINNGATLPSPEPHGKPKKKIIIIATVALVCVIIATLIIVAISLMRKGEPKPDPEEDYSVYMEDENIEFSTGGEDDELPADQQILFLTKYGISEEDAYYVEDKIFEVADEYYEDDGYNDIFYSHDDVKVSEGGNKVFFTAYTDWGDRPIEVTINLVGGKVKTVNIY